MVRFLLGECSFASVLLLVGLITHQFGSLCNKMDLMHKMNYSWVGFGFMYYEIHVHRVHVLWDVWLNNESTDQGQIYFGVFIVQAVHTPFNLVYCCVCEMFLIQILCFTLLQGSLNIMTVLLSHLNDLTVIQSLFVEPFILFCWKSMSCCV